MKMKNEILKHDLNESFTLKKPLHFKCLGDFNVNEPIALSSEAHHIHDKRINLHNNMSSSRGTVHRDEDLYLVGYCKDNNKFIIFKGLENRAPMGAHLANGVYFLEDVTFFESQEKMQLERRERIRKSELAASLINFKVEPRK